MSPLDAGWHFLRLGVEYYTAARAAVLAQLRIVPGNLYHYAIEMLLKAWLSQKHALAELSRAPFGHKLWALWKAFKAEFPTAGLGQFDDTIATLDRFERLRYPDWIMNEGAHIEIWWEPGHSSSTYAPEITVPPTCQIVVTDIDRLVASIFEVSSMDPEFFTSGMPEYAREAITRDNPACGGWFPHR